MNNKLILVWCLSLPLATNAVTLRIIFLSRPQLPMAREATDITDSDNEAVTSSKNRSPNGKKAATIPEDEQSEEQDDKDDDSAAESEYEIEAIMDAKRKGAVSSLSSMESWTSIESNASDVNS